MSALLAQPTQATSAAAQQESLRRTLARLLWSAQAEGLSLLAAPNCADAKEALLRAISALARELHDSCHERGWSFDERQWSQLLVELTDSGRRAALAREQWDERWRPALPASASAFGSLFSWPGTLPAEAEQLPAKQGNKGDGMHACCRDALGGTRSRRRWHG